MKIKKSKKYNHASKIRSALRRLWLFSPERKAALAASKIRGSSLYICSQCRKTFVKQKIHVHHIVPCGESDIGNFDVFIERLFYGKLAVVCHQCHEAIHGKGV